MLGKPRLLRFCFGALLRLELRCCACLVSFSRGPLRFHLRGKRGCFTALYLGLVHAEVPTGADAQHQHRNRGEYPGMNALALRRADRGELALVVKLTSMRFRFFGCFLFEANAELGFLALSSDPLFFLELPALLYLRWSTFRFYLLDKSNERGRNSNP